MKNYKLSDETKTTPWGAVLHRVVATKTFILACGLTIVTEGDVGGWIEKESNLSGNAWVFGDAMIYGDAQVSDNALVYDNAQIYGNAKVSGDAQIYDDAKVFSHARVSGDARASCNAQVCDNARVRGNALASCNALISGNAQISGDAKVMSANDFIVFKSDWSSSRYFTWTKSNDMWAEGSFYGTGDELIKKAYADSEDNGKHYEACVKLVKTL